MIKHLLPFLILLISLVGCDSKEESKPGGQIGKKDDKRHLQNTDYNVLFIGNSLTYTNNLAELVQLNAKSTMNLNIGVHMIASGNYALIDHWSDVRMHEEIESGLYDFVVVQQGPSSQPYGRELLLEYGTKFKALCTDNDTELAFFMVWPSMDYFYTFSGVIESYEMAAEQNNALLCPVGREWKAHFSSTQDYSYYGPDGFHPSVKGSQVAAEVIVESLFE